MSESSTRNRGFASMDPEKQKKIASMGGKKIASKGTEYMSELGRRGGEASGKARQKHP